MRIQSIPPAALLLALGLLAVPVGPAGAEAGKPIFDLRYRFEHVDQDNALRDARMHSLRTRVGYQTGRVNGWSALVEFDHVGHPGGNRFNDTRNGKTGYALIPDPGGAGVNQALLRHDGDYGSVTLGRQRINLGNQRFVGGVGWRQNEQTYDGVLARLTPLPGLDLTYAWIGRVDTIWGPDNGPYATPANPARARADTHLLDLRYKASARLALAAYHYRFGLDGLAISPTAPRHSLNNAVTGLRVQGDHEPFDYVLEYARQRDIKRNPNRMDANYRLIELGAKLGVAKLRLAQEILGAGSAGPGNRAFQTPLATKHAFQGWADQFLATPADGLEDRWASLGLPLAGGNLLVAYHDFSPRRGGGSYGTEWDVSYARAIPGLKGLSGLVKLARYDSDDRSRSVDTRKFWVQLQYAW